MAGSIDRRIEALEKLYHESADEEHSSASGARMQLVDKSVAATLAAEAHIKRAPVDEGPWRFDVEKLRDKGAFAITCYIAALAYMRHPDEQRAREILEEAIAERELDGAPLWEMLSDLIDGFNRMDARGDREAWGLDAS